MLSQEELRRRVRAARVLAAISQADMNSAGHKRGLGKHELGNAERGDIDIRHVHLPMLCEVLGVPMSWFTEPREVIVAQRAADYRAVLEDLVTLVRHIADPDALEDAVQQIAAEGAKRQSEQPATGRAARAKNG